MRVSMLLRLFKPRRISSTSHPSLNSKNFRSWSGGNINLLFLPNFGFTKFHQKRDFSSKQESYFSAIGGESDEPPPELTPEQVTSILTMNEVRFSCTGRIKTIECNQLAANQPIEDRLRVSKLNIKDFKTSFDASSSKEAMIFAVFDGHGGRLCADVVTKRLFSYIALSLCTDPVSVVSNQENLDKIIEDLKIVPNVSQSLSLSYGPMACERIKTVSSERAKFYLERYAQKLSETSFETIEEKISDAFLQCDQDISDEIEFGLSNPISNVLIHYYLSLAVSGCCVSLIMIHGDDCYIASTGDCKAVLGFREDGPSNHVTKSIDLTNEHNSDNASETKRLLSAHPAKEKKTIIKNDRLLSHLMPFRAFGDFCYKWEIEKIKRVGLTQAFGPHIIPPNYLTPPYLTAQPEVSKISLSQKSETTIGSRFIVIATDGLWEQYGSSRCLIKQLFRHQFILNPSVASPNENVPVPKNLKSNQNFPSKEVVEKASDKSAKSKTSVNDEKPSDEGEGSIDANRSTHLIRVALGTPPLSNMVQEAATVDFKLQHKRLSTFLTLPSHLVRNFRDDITVIVLQID